MTYGESTPGGLLRGWMLLTRSLLRLNSHFSLGMLAAVSDYSNVLKLVSELTVLIQRKKDASASRSHLVLI